MNFQVVVDALTKIAYDIVNFIPNLANGLIVLVVGYLVAAVVRRLVGWVLRRGGFDPAVKRMGLTGALEGIGVERPLSGMVAQAVFALLLLSFLITSTRIMGLEPVARVFEQILAFLPTLIAALVVFLLGGVAAQFVGGTVTKFAARRGVRKAAALGGIVQLFASIFVIVITLGVLGMDTALLVTAVTIMIGAFGLALALALGLAARGVARHVLAGYYVKQRFEGRVITFEQVSGTVRDVRAVNTLVETADGAVILPNGLLLDSVVAAQPPPPPAETAT